MNAHQMIALAGACFLAMASPGPGVFAVISRSLALGFRGTVGFILGMVLGDLTLLTLALSGLATAAAAYEPLFRLLTFGAAGYLLYLGITIGISSVRTLAISSPLEMRAEDEPLPLPPPAARGWVHGLVLTLSNPKTILFYLALLPAFVDVGRISASDAGWVAVIVGAVLSLVMSGYALASATARATFRSPRAVAILNICAATVMIGAGVYILLR